MFQYLLIYSAALIASGLTFTKLTDTCNGCHQPERVSFILVSPLMVRGSPAGTPARDGGGR